MEITDEDRRTCRVCVTGGGGYIASWLVRDLLHKGYYVHATFRDPANENKTRHILSLPGARERLTLFKADINEQGSFDSAVHGCDFVVHMATPTDFTKDPETGVIQAAVNGSLDILSACTKAKSVRRVIYTSSITAASPLKGKGESCWTNVDLIRREKPPFWEGVKTRSFRSKGKDKDGLTTVPLTGDQMETRKSKSKQIGPEKEVEISARHRREKK